MFTGNEGEEFPLETASEWTANYRAANPDSTKAHFFGNVILSKILAQTGCVGLRMYYALDDNGDKQMIVVGVDSDGEDQFMKVIAERSWPCPPYCGGGSPLNG